MSRVHGRPWAVRGLLAAGLGAAGTATALWLDPEGALRAYLVAYLFALSLPLGALCLLLVAHVTGAGWFVAVRRPAEAAAITLPLFAVLLLPVLLGLDVLYPWAAPPGSLPPDLREEIALKAGYLDTGFFVVRAAVYFAVWIGLAGLLWRWSVRQDPEGAEGAGPAGTAGTPAADRAPGGEKAGGRPVALSAAGLPAFAFTVTFAAFDWAMSLEPTWYSTMYGVYYFSGAFLGALSLVVLLVAGLERGGQLRGRVAAAHYHALGRLMLTFVVFWAYIAFSQLLIVWIADVPHEVGWYVARWEGGWAWVLVALAVGHFALPFFVLLSRGLKRRPGPLAAVAGWLLLMHWLDVYWLIGPSAAGRVPWPGWEHAAALLTVGGAAVAFGAWRLDGRPAAPLGDPRFERSVRYRSR